VVLDRDDYWKQMDGIIAEAKKGRTKHENHGIETSSTDDDSIPYAIVQMVEELSANELKEDKKPSATPPSSVQSVRLTRSNKKVASVTPSSVAPSIDKVNEILKCPISFQQMQDPVCLVPSGHTYDKKSICEWLLTHPNRDPLSQTKYNEPISYVENIALRQVIMQQHGDAAYVKYNDTAFQKQYVKKWNSFHSKSTEDIELFNGQTITQSYETTVEWYRLAASQGHASAQYNLAEMYQNGDGVVQDNEIAAEWFRQSADQGDSDAQLCLGKLYEDGEGVVKNYKSAIKWYRRAASQGNAEAQWKLGCMYKNGHGVKQCYAVAMEWYRRASEEGNSDAQLDLGLMYENGQQVAKDNRKAVGWYRLAAEQGHAIAQWHLGTMYKKGRGVTKNSKEAVEWFSCSASECWTDAQYDLAVMYDQGDGVKQNYKKAVDW
jgi:TPR repeat protein